MSETNIPEGAGTNGDGGAEAEQTGPQIQVAVQYVKDLSFENPNAPETFIGNETQPQINVGINVDTRALGPSQHEVTLHVTASAKRGEESMFIVELAYAGVFLLSNMTDEMLQAVTLIECPRLLFPFARRVIGDVTRDGGYPPLLLEPIDFAAMYRRQAADTAEENSD